MSKIDTYNGQPILKNIIIDIASMDNIEAKTIKTETLKIDTDNTREQIITNKIILSNNEINKIETIEEAESDNEILPSKAYVDDKLSEKANISDIPDLSECVKNNIDQTLTNKIIMNNSNNEITANKIIINSNEINTIDKVNNDTTTDNKTLYTKKKIDTDFYNKTSSDNRYFLINNNNTYGYNLKITGNISLASADNSTVYQNINHIKLGTSDNAIITSKGYVDDGLSDKITKDVNNLTNYTKTSDLIGKLYSGSTNGEIFNDYSNNQATGNYGHAEGYGTRANSTCAHAEGYICYATGAFGSHAEGENTKASGASSHAGGSGTVADQANQTAIGQNNTKNNSGCLFVVGNGTSYYDTDRSDAFCVYDNGNCKIQNNIYFNNFYSFCIADKATIYIGNDVSLNLIKPVEDVYAYVYGYGYNEKIFISSHLFKYHQGSTNNWPAVLGVKIQGKFYRASNWFTSSMTVSSIQSMNNAENYPVLPGRIWNFCINNISSNILNLKYFDYLLLAMTTNKINKIAGVSVSPEYPIYYVRSTGGVWTPTDTYLYMYLENVMFEYDSNYSAPW